MSSEISVIITQLEARTTQHDQALSRSEALINGFGKNSVASIGQADQSFQSFGRNLAGVGTVASQAGVGIAELSARKAQLLGQVNNVTASIRSETSVLSGAQSAIAGLGGSHTALNSVVKESETKLAGYIGQQALLKGELSTVDKALRVATTSTGAAGTAAKVATAEVSKLGAGVERLATAFVPLRPGVNQAVSAIGDIGGVSLLAAGAMAGLAIGVGLLVKGAYDAASAFDSASDHIRVSTGAIGAELTSLEGSFKTVFTSIPTSSEAAAQAIAFLSARLHLTGDALESLAKQELELSRITGSALGPQLESTTRLFRDWEIATGSQSSALDFLFKVSQKTQIGVTDLSRALVQFGAPLRELGFSFQEAAILIGKFQAEGVELNKVLPGLRIALSKMAKEGVRDAGDAFNFLVEKIQNTKTPLDAVRAAIEIFGRRAGPDMAEAIKQGRFSVQELQKTIADSTDTIVKAATETEDFGEKWIILKNKATQALLPLGKTVFDFLSAVASSFIDTEDEISKRWDQFWKDMKGSTGQGLGEVVAEMITYGDPIQDAGAYLGVKFRDAFVQYVKEAFSNISYPNMPGTQPAEQAKNEQPFIPAGPNPFAGLAEENLRITAAMKAQGREAVNLAGHHKAAAGAAKAAFDEFKAGVAGIDQALAFLNTKAGTTGFEGLFDRIGKSAKEGAAKTVSALKVVTDAINEFLKAEGSGAKFSPEDLAKRWNLTGPLRASADAFAHLKDSIGQVNIDRVVAGFTSLDDSLKVNGKTIEISAQTFDALKAKFPEVISTLSRLGFTFKEVFPAMGVDMENLAASGDKMSQDAGEAFEQMGLSSKNAQKTLQIAFEKMVEDSHHPAGAIVDMARRIGDAMTELGSVLRAKAALDIAGFGEQTIDVFLKLGEQVRLTGDDLIKFVGAGAQSAIADFKLLVDAGKKTQAELVAFTTATEEAFKRMQKKLDELPGALNEIFDRLNLGAKRQVSGLIQVLSNIPGAFGDKLRQTTNVVIDWVNKIDQVLKGLHKIFQSIPDGLVGVLQQVIGIFKGSSGQIQDISKTSVDAVGMLNDAMKQSAQGAVVWGEDINAQLGKIGQQTAGAAGKAGSAVGQQFLKAFSLALEGAVALGGAQTIIAAAGAPNRVAGAIAGGIGGAVAGAMIGTMIAPGIGTAIGAAVGFIAGLIGGIWRSELQKAQEAAGLQQARDAIKLSIQSVAQAIEASKQAVLATASKTADLMNQLFNYAKVPKETIRAFVKNMGDLFVFLAAEIKRLAPEALIAIKNAGESLSPAADLLGKMPLVFDGINSHIALAQGQVDLYFHDWDELIARLGISAEATPKKLLKHIKRFSELLSPAADLMSKVTGGLKDMFDLKPVPVGSFDIWEAGLDTFVARLGPLAEKFGKQFVKNISFFAEQVTPGVALWKDVSDALRSMFELPQPTEKDYETLFSGLDTGLRKSMELAAKYTKEALAWTVEFFGLAKDVYAGVTGGVDVINAVAKAETVDVSRWGIFADAIAGMADFVHRSLGDMLRARDDSIVMVGASQQLHDNILAAAFNVADAATQAAAMFRAAGFGGDGSFNVTQTVGALALPSGGSLGSLGSLSAPSGRGSGEGDVYFQSGAIVIQGSLITEARVEDTVVRAIEKARRRGRN